MSTQALSFLGSAPAVGAVGAVGAGGALAVLLACFALLAGSRIKSPFVISAEEA